MIILRSSLSKTSFFKMIPPTLKRKTGVFKSLWFHFDDCFQKLHFGDGLMWYHDDKPNR